MKTEFKESDRDWKEDFNLENGNYYCYCRKCKKTFTGYKRRVICKVCATKNNENKSCN